MTERNTKVVEVKYINIDEMTAHLAKFAPGGDLTNLPQDFRFDIVGLTSEGFTLLEITPAQFSLHPLGHPCDNFAHVCESYIKASADAKAFGDPPRRVGVTLLHLNPPEAIQEVVLDLRIPAEESCKGCADCGGECHKQQLN